MFSRAALFLLPALLFALAHAPAALAQRGNPDLRWRGQSIDAMVAQFMAENDIPGLSLAIVQAPYIPRAVGYGLSDTRTRLLVGTHTLFDVGQMAHAFAGVALMQLVETGRLSLDDPVGEHLTDLPAHWRAVPVRALLAHASGIPEDGDAAKALAFAPGSRVAQSAMDTRLLARVVEAAAKEPYRDFVRKNQFERLGLARTVFAEDASAHLHSEDVTRNGNRHQDFLTDPRLLNPPEQARGSGALPSTRPAPDAILASAVDISLWDIGLAGSILVRDPALRAILYAPLRSAEGGGTTSTVPVMGGWRFPGRKGLMYITGSSNGQSAFLSRFTDPSELVCVTLLANREGVDFTQLARRIAGAYDPRLGPPDAPGLRVQQSPWPVAQTLARFRAALEGQGLLVQPQAGGDPAKRKVAKGTNRGEESGPGTASAGPASPQRQQEPLRMAFSFPNPAPWQRGKTFQAVAWEEDGQVWLGCTDPLDPAGQLTRGAGPGQGRVRGGSLGTDGVEAKAGAAGSDRERLALRHVLDRLLLQAVTPY